MAVETFIDSEDFSYLEFYQRWKNTPYIRKVQQWTVTAYNMSVGYESWAAAHVAAQAYSAVSGNTDVKVVPVGGGLFNVTYTSTTVTETYGNWFIPAPGQAPTPTPTPSQA